MHNKTTAISNEHNIEHNHTGANKHRAKKNQQRIHRTPIEGANIHRATKSEQTNIENVKLSTNTHNKVNSVPAECLLQGTKNFCKLLLRERQIKEKYTKETGKVYITDLYVECKRLIKERIGETKKKGEEEEKIENDLDIWRGVSKDRKAKLSVIKNKWINSMGPEKLVKITLNIHEQTITIIGTYGINDNDDTKHK
ncbi:hypothetical protein FQA39_LY06976 [Lamprigera yunnana]|nr:hypothetical protein FQA39_LY06976 [Lamprigera yunnana]